MRRTLVRAMAASFMLILLVAPARAAERDARALAKELQLVPVAPVAPPAFTLNGLDGKRTALAELKGRPALLYFWATW